MGTTQFVYNDGGRSKYFKAKNVGDCVTRAIAIATGRDYKKIYDMVDKAEKTSRGRKKGSARNGAYKKNYAPIIERLGGVWHPTMQIGKGCKVHVRADELPAGRIICQCSRHLIAVIDGVINDTYDSSRGGTRCVYGYWKF
jgi:hypothetical protein